MKKTLQHLSCLFILIAFIDPQLFAQDTSNSAKKNTTLTSTMTGTKQFRKLSIGINAGVLAPVTIFGGKNDFTKWLPTFGYSVNIKNQFTHNIALQADLLKGSLE